MATFYVARDFERSESAGAGGMFQIETLLDEKENNVTNQVDVGKHFHSNQHLAEYLSGIFGIPKDEITIEVLE